MKSILTYCGYKFKEISPRGCCLKQSNKDNKINSYIYKNKGILRATHNQNSTKFLSKLYKTSNFFLTDFNPNHKQI